MCVKIKIFKYPILEKLIGKCTTDSNLPKNKVKKNRLRNKSIILFYTFLSNKRSKIYNKKIYSLK